MSGLRRLRAALIAAAVVAVVPAGVGSAQAAGTLTFGASADTYVSSADPATPKGALLNMRANGTPEQVSYVKFVVTGIPAGSPVGTATLHLTGGSPTQPTQTVTVWTVGNTWDEGTTYNTRPALGARVATGTMGTGAALAVPVPVSGNGTVSFAITAAGTTASGSAIMSTRENTLTVPTLEVAYNDPPPPAFPAGTWNMNCFSQPYAFAQTTAPNGAISRRFEVRSGDRAPGDINLHPTDVRQRCEQKNTDTFWSWDTDVWLSYDFQWSGTVPTSGSHHNIINQWQQTPEPNCDTAGHPPSLSLGFRNGNFDLSKHSTTAVCDTVQPANETLYAQPWFPPNTWERIVLHTRMNPAGTGLVELWLNGAKVYTGTGLSIGYALNTEDLSYAPHYSDGEYRDGQPDTTVFTVANLQLGTADLSSRVSNPPPLPN
jgi:hypothetical protein